MKFTLIIDCGNAAFDNLNAEVARILRKLATDLEFSAPDAGTLADVFGNTVGSFAFLPDAPR